MAAGRGGGQDRTVEEVEAEARQGSSCSPVVCILSLSLCLILTALIVVTALHTHTKLQAADDSSSGCPVAATGLRGPCHPQRLNFTVDVGAGASACSNWFEFACPAASGKPAKTANVSYPQLLLLGLARAVCPSGASAVEKTMLAFFNTTDLTAGLLKPAFNC